MTELVASLDPAASPMDIGDEDGEQAYIDDHRTKLQVKSVNIDEYLKRNELLELDQLDDCDYPRRGLSQKHSECLMQSRQRKGL